MKIRKNGGSVYFRVRSLYGKISSTVPVILLESFAEQSLDKPDGDSIGFHRFEDRFSHGNFFLADDYDMLLLMLHTDRRLLDDVRYYLPFLDRTNRPTIREYLASTGVDTGLAPPAAEKSEKEEVIMLAFMNCEEKCFISLLDEDASLLNLYRHCVLGYVTPYVIVGFDHHLLIANLQTGEYSIKTLDHILASAKCYEQGWRLDPSAHVLTTVYEEGGCVLYVKASRTSQGDDDVGDALLELEFSFGEEKDVLISLNHMRRFGPDISIWDVTYNIHRERLCLFVKEVPPDDTEEHGDIEFISIPSHFQLHATEEVRRVHLAAQYVIIEVTNTVHVYMRNHQEDSAFLLSARID